MRRVESPDKMASEDLDTFRYFTNDLNIMTRSDPTLFSVARRQWPVLVVLLVIAVLARVNGLLRPDEAAKWHRAMLMPPLLWLGLTAWHLSMLKSLRRRGVEDESAVTRYFDSVMVLVFAVISVPIGAVRRRDGPSALGDGGRPRGTARRGRLENVRAGVLEG